MYANEGRSDIQSVHKAFQYLGISSGSSGLNPGRKLLKELPKNNLIRRKYEERFGFGCASEIDFADMYLHPKEVNYSLDKLYELIDSTGLEFAGFSNPQVWDLTRLLKGELLDRAEALPNRSQWKLVEALDLDINHFEFFLMKGNVQKYQWTNDDALLAATSKVSSCIVGWPGKTLFDSEMNQLEVSADGLELMEAIQKLPGIPLGSLPLSWSKKQVAFVARDLQQKQLVLLYPA